MGAFGFSWIFFYLINTIIKILYDLTWNCLIYLLVNILNINLLIKKLFYAFIYFLSVDYRIIANEAL